MSRVYLALYSVCISLAYPDSRRVWLRETTCV